MTLSYTQITETFDDGSGSPLSGLAEFTINTPLYASGVPLLQPNVPIQAQIIAGQLRSPSGGTLQLLDLASTGISMVGQTGFWFWTVSITVGGQVLPSWSFFLNHSSTPVDLYSLANTSAGGGGSGFANPMTTLGDMIDGGASGAATRLAGNTTATREFLRSQGSGTAATAPAWDTLQAGDLPAATSGAQGAVQLTGDLGGTAASPQVTGTHLAGPLPIAQGGTSGATQQAAIDALTGTQAAGHYLRSDGTNAALGAIQAADVPTLNQSTTGTAANVTGTVAIGNGGTGQVTQQAALDALAGAVTSGQFLRGNGTNVVLAAIQAGDLPAAVALLTGIVMTGYLAPAVVALTDAATIAVDASQGNDFRVTLGGNRTMGAPSNPRDGQKITFEIIQPASGGPFGVTWASGAGGYSFGSGSAPTLSTAASATDQVAFRYSASKGAWLALGSTTGF